MSETHGTRQPREIDPDLPHNKWCWQLVGHHACSLRRMRRNRPVMVLRAFRIRGDMIANLTAQLLRVRQENERLRKGQRVRGAA